MSSILPFNLQFGTNASSVFGSINNGLNEIQESTQRVTRSFEGSYKVLMAVNSAADGLEQIHQSFEKVIAPGISLNSQMTELSAITNVTGDALDRVEMAARSTAKTFGTNASNNVESYKLILSQLDPAIAKNAEAMKLMGENVNYLSKSMSGDTVAATNVLTTAMNQFGVSTENPIAAAKVMADMMNVMAAGAQVGSAELPQIQSALEQVGMVAKTTGLSFVETNAQIQLLDKAGKKGSEGGVALRNVLTTLSEGRFASKDATEGLKQYGISTIKLADASIPLTDRLRMLRPVINDTALMTKVFGKENMAAGIAMIKGADTADQLAKQITGTNSAVEQANVVMSSYQEQMNRWKAKIEDVKISFFNLTEAMLPATQQFFSGMSAVGEAARGYIALKTTLEALFPRLFLKTVATTADTVATEANTVSTGAASVMTRFFSGSIFSVNTQMTIGAVASRIYSVAVNSVRNAMLGATGAIDAFSVAIMNIPVIGWVIAAIVAVIVIIKLLWDHSKRFREILFGIWEAAKAVFHNIGVVIKRVWESIVKPVIMAYYTFYKFVFTKIWEFIKFVFNTIADIFVWLYGVAVSVFTKVRGFVVGVFQWVVEKVSSALQVVGSFFSGLWHWFSSVFSGFVKFIDEWLVQPIKKAFSGVWNWIVGIFEKIMDKLTGVFAPIKKFFKTLFSSEGMTDVKAAYKEGEKKGAASFDKDHPKDKEEKDKKKQEKKPVGMDVAGLFDVTKGSIPKMSKIAQDSGKENADGKGKGKTVGNLNITKLVESINIYNQNGTTMDKQAIVNLVKEALLTATADYTLGLEHN